MTTASFPVIDWELKENCRKEKHIWKYFVAFYEEKKKVLMLEMTQN